MLKKILINTRKSIKFVILLIIAAFLIIGLVAYFYKPTYRVLIDGQQVGYTSNKSQLQAKINNYIQNGDGQNVAFVQVDKLPEYQLCLLKRGIVTNDDEIYENVKNSGTTYYRDYAISQNGEEKAYVSTFSEAEKVVNTLKEKNSANIEGLAISEKYETEAKEFVNAEQAVSKLYVEPTKQVEVAKLSNTSASNGKVNTSYKVSNGKADLGISLIKHISGIIT